LLLGRLPVAGKVAGRVVGRVVGTVLTSGGLEEVPRTQELTMQEIYRVVITLHVLAAVIWVGGVFFMGMVVVPVTRPLPEKLRVQLLDRVGRSFRLIGWSALGVLVGTGAYLMWHWGARWDNLMDMSFFAHGHTRELGYKLILIVFMLVVSGLHDFWLGPRATREGRTEEEAARDRRLASWLGRVTGVAVLLIVILAVSIARPWI
jgi:copper resistance protein D